jgi:hypothetical protein
MNHDAKKAGMSVRRLALMINFSMPPKAAMPFAMLYSSVKATPAIYSNYISIIPAAESAKLSAGCF